jgi:hypothetical protein
MKYRDSIGSWFAGKWHLHLAFQSFHQGTEFSQTASKTVKTSSCLDSFCQVSCPSNPPWNLSSSAHPSQNCTQLQLGGRENGHQLILHLIMDGHHSVEDHWLIERRICADILIQCVLHSVPAVLEGANLFAKSDCSPLLQSAQSISVRHTKKDQPLQQPTRMEQLWIMQHFREISKTRVNNVVNNLSTWPKGKHQ